MLLLNIQSTTEAPGLQAHDPKIQSESEDAGVVDSRETPDISMKSDTKAINQGSSPLSLRIPKTIRQKVSHQIAFLLHPQFLFVNLIYFYKI
jgi:hypothetical protein